MDIRGKLVFKNSTVPVRTRDSRLIGPGKFSTVGGHGVHKKINGNSEVHLKHNEAKEKKKKRSRSREKADRENAGTGNGTGL